MKEETIHNPQLQLAHDFVQYTGQHIFLTGKAGTGKTTFLHRLKEQSPKRMIVVAPTGVAAINARGMTIHSFFQISFGPQVPGYSGAEQQGYKRFSKAKRNIIKSLDLLVIDEISMVRADLLDGIDETLRRFRNNNQPFGGVQLLMIGDMQQLAPVVKDDEWNILRHHYKTAFFFGSNALQRTNYITIVLHHVYRQSDPHFIELLNKIRDNSIDSQVTDMLNERYQPGFDPGNEPYIILTTHNAKARRVNDSKLEKLKGKPVRFRAEIVGNFPEYTFPTDEDLMLKPEAQVMFVKNDPDAEKRYFNGKIGKVIALEKNEVIVQCPEDDEPIHVAPVAWQNIRYAIDDDTKEINETIDGTFIQMPLKPAWAITIHKSQGLTFDKAIIDSEQAFAHGQVYVALSRCRSLEGLVLSSPFSANSLKHDKTIEGFSKETEENQPGEEELLSSKKQYQENLLTDLFDFGQLQKSMYYFQKVLHDNQSAFQSDQAENFKSLNTLFQDEITTVAGKFQKQIHHYLLQNNDVEKNDELQQRIKKAAAYFKDKLHSHVVEPVENFSFDTDNKEVRKTIGKAEERLHEEADFKMACLNACLNGFNVKDYLAGRAKAALEKPSAKPRKKPSVLPVSSEISNPALYQLIKTWRNAKSAELGYSHFMVLPLKTMRALSNQLPSRPEELKKVHGLGKRKLERFGSELLELINAYREENDVQIAETPSQIKAPKKPRQDTRKVSMELWNSLRDIEKVAEERGMVVSTIEGHLARSVSNGDLPVSDFIDEEKLKQIISFFKKNGKKSLGEARLALGEKYTWSELRFVQHHLIYVEKSTSSQQSDEVNQQ